MRLSWHIRMKSKREWQNFFLPNLFPRALFNVFVESEWPAPGLSSSRWCGSPTFSPLFHHLFVDGHCWPAEGGVGVFLIIIDVTDITVNVVITLGSKPSQTLGYILYIIYIHIHVVYYICRGWITLYGQVCHTWAPRVTQCERVCPAPHRAWLCLVMQE